MNKYKIVIVLVILIGVIGAITITKRVVDENRIKEQEMCAPDTNPRKPNYYGVVLTKDRGDRNTFGALCNDRREDWKYIPLSDKFKKKYENRKVIEDDDVIEFVWENEGEKSYERNLPMEEWTNRLECIKKDGLYVYTFDVDVDKYNFIDDIKVKSIIKIFDNETGYTDDYYIKITENTYMALGPVLFPNYYKDADWVFYKFDRHNVALTKNFLDKYGYDKDIFSLDSDTPVTNIEVNLEKSNFEERKLVFTVAYEYQNEIIDYVVKFKLSDDGELETANQKKYLDDAYLNNMESTIIDDSLDKYVFDGQIERVVMVKNSNWNRCPLSKRFLEKYNNRDSIFPQYDIVADDSISMDRSKFKKITHKDLLKLTDRSGVEIICLFYVIWNDNNEVDDILTYVIPEVKMDLTYEEMYGLAFNDIDDGVE